jgi:dTDP-4-amino-4,6-dideoxygalactose transaminase
VVTNSDFVHGRVLELRDHGRGADGGIVSWGLNSRLDNLQAAILEFRLASYPTAIDRRRALARIYGARLGSIEQLVLPPGPADHVEHDAEHVAEHFDVFQNYEIEADRRDDLRAFLKSRQIGSALPWGGKAVHQWPRLNFQVSLPFTEKLFEKVLLLPLNLSLSDDHVHTVCDAIETFYRLG